MSTSPNDGYEFGIRKFCSRWRGGRHPRREEVLPLLDVGRVRVQPLLDDIEPLILVTVVHTHPHFSSENFTDVTCIVY